MAALVAARLCVAPTKDLKRSEQSAEHGVYSSYTYQLTEFTSFKKTKRFWTPLLRHDFLSALKMLEAWFACSVWKTNAAAGTAQ